MFLLHVISVVNCSFFLSSERSGESPSGAFGEWILHSVQNDRVTYRQGLGCRGRIYRVHEVAAAVAGVGSPVCHAETQAEAGLADGDGERGVLAGGEGEGGIFGGDVVCLDRVCSYSYGGDDCVLRPCLRAEDEGVQDGVVAGSFGFGVMCQCHICLCRFRGERIARGGDCIHCQVAGFQGDGGIFQVVLDVSRSGL